MYRLCGSKIQCAFLIYYFKVLRKSEWQAANLLHISEREHFKEAAASKMLSPRVSIIFAVYISFVNGQQDPIVDCREGLSRRLRLQGGTDYAGRLEVCWNNNGTSRYNGWLCVVLTGVIGKQLLPVLNSTTTTHKTWVRCNYILWYIASWTCKVIVCITR